MADEPRKPTKAQRQLLEWMVMQELKELSHRALVPARARQGEPVTFRGGDLMAYYSAKNRREGRHTYGTHGGGYAGHGWRRAGGTALMHLQRFGFARVVRWPHGVPEYVLTDAGREIGQEGT